ncbi:hypothetical protein, partial [Micromonospora sp. LOL_015]|uniref:hypothetical protein n=1 Tax=Micromonospora sp. LOL_015 TaxID=3345416 RepID=UPI003A864C09
MQSAIGQERDKIVQNISTGLIVVDLEYCHTCQSVRQFRSSRYGIREDNLQNMEVHDSGSSHLVGVVLWSGYPESIAV